MELKSNDLVSYPVEKVYFVVRDQLQDLVPFLPNVKALEVVAREEVAPGHLKLVNHWHGKANVPAAVAAFLKPEMFSWKDFAEWKEEGFVCSWRLETFYLNNLFTCAGQTIYRPVEGNKTEIALSGDFQINIDAVPGVPFFLKSTVKPQVEKFIINMVTPNLTMLAKGVEGYLKDQRK